MRTCPRKAGFFTLKSATNLIHFSWSKTVEIGEKEEEVQTDQGAGNDNAMGVLFSPEDGEALDEQLEGSIDDEEGDMHPLNLDFGDADANDDDDDGDYDEFQDVPEKFDDKCTGWTREEFIKEIYDREGCDGLFEGYDYNEVRTEMKKLKSGKPSTSVHHFNLNVLRQHWKKIYVFATDKPALSPHQKQQQKKERSDSNTWHKYKWSEAEQLVNLNINGANSRECKITQPYMRNAGPSKKFMTWYNDGKIPAAQRNANNEYFQVPVDIFERVFPRQLVQAIVKSTNCNIKLTQEGQRFYAVENATGSNRPPQYQRKPKKTNDPKHVTEAEMMKYIALSMHAGWNRRPQMKMLWAQDYGSKFMIDSGISYERWQEINEFIHIGVGDDIPNPSGMDKMRKLVVECNKIWLEQWNCGQTAAMDEKTYPASCRHPFGLRAWYHPNKPHKNGPQSYAICSAGYTLFNWMKFDNCECKIKVRDADGNVQQHKKNTQNNRKGDDKIYNSNDNRWHENDCTCQCVPWKTDWGKFNWGKFKAHLMRKGIDYTVHTKLQLTILYMSFVVDHKDNWRTLVMDNFFTSVKMASALLKMGWSMVGTLAKKRGNTGTENDARVFRLSVWSVNGKDLKIHEGELGHTNERTEKEMDVFRSKSNVDDRNLCYVNKEGCFVYGFVGERGTHHFRMISTKPLPHAMVTKNLTQRQLHFAESNNLATTKEVTEIQNFYNAHMGAVDIADQLALVYSKVDFTRTLRWPTVLFQWYFDTARVNAYVLHRRAAESQRHVGRQDHAVKPLTHLDFTKSVCEGYMQKAKDLEGDEQRGRVRRQQLRPAEESVGTTTPSTKNTGLESTKIMEPKLQMIVNYFKQCVKHLENRRAQGKPRLVGIHFTDQAKFNNTHYQKVLTQTSKTNKQRCQCCHIFGSSRDQRCNLYAVYVCECKEEGVTALNGACDKTMYCSRCWNIMHYRESFSANIADVEKWLNKQGSKSTRTKASSCNASSIGSSRRELQFY